MRKITMLAMAAAFTFTAGNAVAQNPKHPMRESQAELAREARVTPARARAIALADMRGARVRSEELERENGRLIYSFDLTMPGRSGFEEVHVDAMSGRVISRKHESAKAEKREMKGEKKDMKMREKEMKRERKQMQRKGTAAMHTTAWSDVG